jgi:hypothetical protein
VHDTVLTGRCFGVGAFLSTSPRPESARTDSSFSYVRGSKVDWSREGTEMGTAGVSSRTTLYPYQGSAAFREIEE